jgi:hypothetical protein
MIKKFDDWLNESSKFDSNIKYEDLTIAKARATIDTNNNKIIEHYIENDESFKGMTVDDFYNKYYEEIPKRKTPMPLTFYAYMKDVLKLKDFDEVEENNTIIKYQFFKLSDIKTPNIEKILEGKETSEFKGLTEMILVESYENISDFFEKKQYNIKIKDVDLYRKKYRSTSEERESIIKNFLLYAISLNDDNINDLLIKYFIKELSYAPIKISEYFRFIDLDIKDIEHPITNCIRLISEKGIKELSSLNHIFNSGLTYDEYVQKYVNKIKVNRYGI